MLFFSFFLFVFFCQGSGKTYTMGSANSTGIPENNQGIISRVIREMYGHVTSNSSRKQFTIKASFIEIYNDEIRVCHSVLWKNTHTWIISTFVNPQDLLDPNPNKKISVREERGEGILLVGVEERPAATPHDLAAWANKRCFFCASKTNEFRTRMPDFSLSVTFSRYIYLSPSLICLSVCLLFVNPCMCHVWMVMCDMCAIACPQPARTGIHVTCCSLHCNECSVKSLSRHLYNSYWTETSWWRNESVSRFWARPFVLPFILFFLCNLLIACGQKEIERERESVCVWVRKTSVLVAQVSLSFFFGI